MTSASLHAPPGDGGGPIGERIARVLARMFAALLLITLLQHLILRRWHDSAIRRED